MSSLHSFIQKYDPNVDVSNKTDPLVIHSISIQRSDSKKASDMEAFKEWFDPLESYFDTELSKWDGTDTIVGNEREHAISYIGQRIHEEDDEKIDEHTKERLHYVLDKSIGWTYGKFWWMINQCMMSGDREGGEYDILKVNTGKVKKQSNVNGGNTREFKNRWVAWLDDWISNNLSSTPARMMNQAEEHRFFQFANWAISKDKRMIGTRKTKLHHLLGTIIGRSYEEIVWATIASFGLGVGSRGDYKCGVCKSVDIIVDKAGHDCPYCRICYNESGLCISKVKCRCTCTVCEGSHATRNCPMKIKKRKSM